MDFPAPFGPSKPTHSPRRTSRSSLSMATKSPKRFVTPRAWIAAASTEGADDLSSLESHGHEGLVFSRPWIFQPRSGIFYRRGDRSLLRFKTFRPHALAFAINLFIGGSNWRIRKAVIARATSPSLEKTAFAPASRSFWDSFR